MGVMAIQLILLSVNKVNPTLQGSVKLLCDCLGALNKVKTLPSDRIPCRSKHSDILKNIMINCSNMSFHIEYEHVEAHQDDHNNFEELSFFSQLNCIAIYLSWESPGHVLDMSSDNPFVLYFAGHRHV